MSANPFRVGDEVHGFADGYFGRDSYGCRRVEAVGADWIVTRKIEPTGSEPTVEFVSGKDELAGLAVTNTNRVQCDHDEPMEPGDAPSLGDSCCGACPGGTCYVDAVTGA